jgi:Raf kinase inhibitor-like YbhB/YbcL family protein
MLEKTPAPIGHLLERVRAGMEKLVWENETLQAPDSIVLTSEAFEPDTPIPARYTADGKGCSPPLAWKDLPPAAAEVVLIVEDADSPTPIPLLHLIAWGLPAGQATLADGALPSKGHRGRFLTVGKNSFRRTEYLPPDPPTGHGHHRYVFQLFAVDHPLDLRRDTDKDAILRALRGHVLARGRLVGLYGRGADR